MLFQDHTKRVNFVYQGPGTFESGFLDALICLRLSLLFLWTLGNQPERILAYIDNEKCDDPREDGQNSR
jgi:hypothetical protein